MQCEGRDLNPHPEGPASETGAAANYATFAKNKNKKNNGTDRLRSGLLAVTGRAMTQPLPVPSVGVCKSEGGIRTHGGAYARSAEQADAFGRCGNL